MKTNRPVCKPSVLLTSAYRLPKELNSRHLVRVLDYALATDGGSQLLVLELDDGKKLTFGLDGRTDSPASGNQIFTGSSPDSPDARLLPVGGTGESSILSLLEKWLDQTQGFIRREALMEADPSALKGQDLLDRLALEFILEQRDRDIP